MKFKTIIQLEKEIEELENQSEEGYSNEGLWVKDKEFAVLKANCQPLKQVVALIDNYFKSQIKIMKETAPKQKGSFTFEEIKEKEEFILNHMLNEIKTAIQGK